MFQKIIESHKGIHTLDNGTLISGVEVELIDSETNSQTDVILQEVLKSLPEKVLLRVIMKSNFETDSTPGHARYDAIKKVGFIQMKAYFIFEISPTFGILSPKLKIKAEEDFNLLENLTELPAFKMSGLSVRIPDKSEIEDIFPKLQDEIYHDYQTIDTGSEVLSILRLTKQSEFGIAPSTLSHLKDSLSLPYLISVSIKPISQAMSEAMLRKRSKQTSTGTDLKEARKFSEAQTDLEDVALNGSKLFQMEWLAVINRKNEDWLRTDREDCKRRLSELGEVYIETVGALNSLKAIYPGGGQHVRLIEKDDVIPYYLPITTRGDGKLPRNVSPRSLALHRKDDSLTHIDIFDPTYESFSWCIFGRPGTGKSVLVNAITKSLAHDPEIKIIKIDVGGSHSRETEMLGGLEKTLSLNEPTGINPFEILEDLGPSKEAIQILASFLEVLILEEGETKLSKTLKSDIEQIIQAFAETNSAKNLANFHQFASQMPRRNLLARWVGNGVYGNAFVTNRFKPRDISPSLLYYNFSKISQAQDPDYAQGGLAAVMAQFNHQMLKKSEHGKRIVFIADETPFFIQKCFNFFNLSIANIRKEGHGFITVAQKSAHVVVSGDTGILDNSPNKVFFSVDGEAESFMARTQLSQTAVEKINSLQRRNGEFSECFLKDQNGERILKIRLSPEEYWSYTSKDEDKRKFYELRNACPSLELEEVIKCLSL